MTLPKIDDWQEAVDIAHAATVMAAAQESGLLGGGPVVDLDACAEILRVGKDKGFSPSPNAIPNLVRHIGVIS